ncbi:Uncharacterized protein Adt_30599 [Abeliophyllum distichum]|uniref:Transposase n=1 Tax=Abeliophyllum distichum TaxID=126358 RepID=A0ABD1RDG6_9LAMI
MMQLVDDVESYIFRHDFYENYERWIYHGESVEGPVNMQGQNEGLVAEDEMANVLNDVVRDDSSAATSDLGYDALFDAMHSELYGGDEPPHQHVNRLQADCQTDRYILLKCSSPTGKKPLPIDFDTKEGTYLPTGENQKYLSRIVGTHVRQFVHPYFDRWANVPEEQKARATGCVYEFFDVNPRRYSKADYKLIVDGIEDTAARRYRQYKADVNAYIRDKGTVVPYRGLTTDVWKKCIERSSSKKFKENMVEEREEQTQKASSSSVAVNEHDVVLKVLGREEGPPGHSWTGSEGHFPLSLVHYKIAGPTQYQSIY